MSSYAVTLSWALDHNMPIVGTYGGGSTSVIMGKQVIKGITKKVVKKVVVKPEAKERGKITLDEAKMIQLGGPFEKIGEENEVVGGRSQKVGSKNK